MVANAAEGPFQTDRSVSAIRKRGFLGILEVEEQYQFSCTQLIADVRSALSRGGRSAA
jgi:hypothetical protein